MQIEYIPIDRLAVSKANMRAGRKPPDVSDILPSIIKRGVIIPLIVRPSASDGDFEICAGKRRYFASLAAFAAGRADEPLPCIAIAANDDAEALEISMIENMLRQSPDPVTQWESFARLVKEGRKVDEIAATFALTELQVKRILALGNLLPRIREAYRAEEIDTATVKHLTLATKAQQRAWLALVERLLELPDAAVMEVLAVVMAETLASGSDLIETLGPVLSVDMADYWAADPAFFELLRDREVATAVLAEVGGDALAAANAKESGKTIKGVIADCLTGENGRPKREAWVPRWMAFPPSAYTARGGVATVTAAERARWIAEQERPRERDSEDGEAETAVEGEDGRLAA